MGRKECGVLHPLALLAENRDALIRALKGE